MIDRGLDDLVFRSLAAPGLEEDDLVAARGGLPVPGPFWGDGWPAQPRREETWSEEAERRRRRHEAMRRWGTDENWPGRPG